MSDESNVGIANQPERGEIAKRILVWATGGIVGLSALVLIGAAIVSKDKFSEISGQVFNALLPLLGTWVGTVLAFYFSKANFEAANQSVKDMVQITVQQKLAKLKVEKEMIPAAKVQKLSIPSGKDEHDVTVADLRGQIGGKITRVPVVVDTGVLRYIVHQSLVYKFLAERGLELANQGKSADIAKLTLAEMLAKDDMRKWTTALAYVSIGASIADAKAAMENKPECQDVIVTQNGRADEPLLGWLTNVDIGRLVQA